MIHGCIGEGTARILVTIITIGFRCTVHNWDMCLSGRILVIADTLRICTAFVMATRSLAATRHPGMVEGDSIGKVNRIVARTAILRRHLMCWRFA